MKFKEGDVVTQLGGMYRVIVTDGEPLDDECFCGVIVSAEYKSNTVPWCKPGKIFNDFVIAEFTTA